jgi:Ser/Thr protein kinase RdoA (MazF antagonist)
MEEAVIKELEQRYGFTVEGTPLRLGGLSNENYQLETSRGKVVIKKYNSNSNEEIQKIEHQALGHLHTKGINYVPRLLIYKNDAQENSPNDQTTIRIGSDVYALFEYIEAREYHKRVSQITDAGRKLGLIHGGLEDLGSVLENISRRKTIGVKKEWLEKIKEYGKKRRDIGAEVIAILKETTGDIESQDLKETQFHADYHPGNVLFDDEGVLAVLDFEAVFKHGHRILDLSFAAYNFGMKYHPTTWKLKDIDVERFQSFLKGYHEAAPLTSTEIVLLPEALITHRAEYLCQYLEEAAITPSKKREQNIKEAVLTIKLAWQKRKMITPFML